MVLEQMIESLVEMVSNITFNFGIIGVIVGMFLASSVLPIPSEAVLIAAGAIGLDIVTISIFGAIGSTLGAVVIYYIGKTGGRMSLDRYGKYFLVSPKKLKLFDNWFERWGSYSVLLGRIIPVIPHKIFSIGAGFGKMDFKKFFIFTLIGSIPRCFLLAYFGSLLSETGNIPLMIISLAIFCAIPVIIDRLISRKRKKE